MIFFLSFGEFIGEKLMEEKFLASTTKPEDFKSDRNVVTCFIESNNHFLLVKRHPKTTQGGKWCLPGGKLEKGETYKEGIIREVYEEVGIELTHSLTEDYGKLYIQRHDSEFIMHLFSFSFDVLPKVILNLNEHTEAKWVTYEKAKEMELILGGLKTLDHLIYVKNIKKTK